MADLVFGIINLLRQKEDDSARLKSLQDKVKSKRSSQWDSREYSTAGELMLKRGDTELHLYPKKVGIKQSIKIDEIEIPKSSGKIKQVLGYEDTEISITIELTNLEENGKVVKPLRERVESLQKLYREGKQKLPVPLTLVSPLPEIAGIDQVYWKELQLEDDPEGYNLVTAQCVFVQFNSIKTQLENQALAQSAQQALQSDASANMPAEMQRPDTSQDEALAQRLGATAKSGERAGYTLGSLGDSMPEHPAADAPVTH
ncbi:MAG: hypothetical protein OEM52_07465 [bacterium]|nr:hypothetical protein [bacterium]